MNLRLLVVTTLLSISCAQTLPLEGAPCPCASGWVCCPGAQVCAKDTASCPAQPAPVLVPAALTVSVTRRFTFKSSEPVDFSVTEPQGGSIDSSGHYTAPATPGTFHVVATRQSDHVAATAEVTVVPLQLASIAGRYGGPSSAPIDGTGEDARFALPTGGAFVDGFFYLLDHNNRFVGGTGNLRRVELATGKVETLFQGFYIPYPGQNLAPVVDGPRATATFAAPTSVASDSQGHLLVADGCLIRSIDLSDLSVKTLMGGELSIPDCQAAFVVGLASDGADTIYYTLGDPFFGTGGKETVVRQLTVSTGAKSILAGQLGVSGTTDGAQGTFTNPGALAYFHEQFNPTLQVFDDYDQKVRSIALSGGEVSTIAGPGGSPFVAIAAPPTSYGGMLAQADGTMSPTAYDKLQGFHPTLPVHPTGLAVIPVQIAGPGNVTPACDGTWTCPIALVPTTEGTFDRFDLTAGLLETIAGRIGSPPDARDGNGEAASFALGSYYPPLLAAAGDDLFIWEPSRSIRKIDRAKNVTTPWTNIDATVLAGSSDTLFLASTTLLMKAPSAGGDWVALAGSTTVGHAVDGTGSAAGFAKIAGLVVEPSGKLAVIDVDYTPNYTALLREVDPATGAVKTIGALKDMLNGEPLLFDFPAASVTMGPPGKLIALSNYGVHSIDLATGQVDELFTDFINGNSFTNVAFDSGHVFLTSDSVVTSLDFITHDLTSVVGQTGNGAVRPGSLDHALLHRPGPMTVLPNGDLAILDLEERVLVEVK